MNTMTFQQGTVLLVGRSRVACLSAMRAFGESGYPVDAIVSCLKPGGSNQLAECRFAREVYEAVSPRKKDFYDESILCTLLEYAADHFGVRTLVFPCDAYASRVIDLFKEELSQHFLLTGTRGSLPLGELFFNGDLLDAARDAGVPTRRRWIVSLEDYAGSLSRMYYPCVCAPVDALPEMGRESRRVDTPEKLLHHLDLLASRKSDRQAKIVELDASTSQAAVYCACLDGKVIPCGVVVDDDVEDDSIEDAAVVDVYDVSAFADLAANAVAVLSGLDFTGVCAAVFGKTEEGYLFKGANLAMTASDQAFLRNGVSPLPLVADYLFTGKVPEAPQSSPFHERVLNENTAWRHYLKGKVSKAEVQQALEGATMLLIDDGEDARVVAAFKKQVMKGARTLPAKRIARAVKPVVRDAYHVAMRYPQTKRKNRRDPESERPRVIVAGRTYSSNLCMARSLGEAGYDVEVLRVFIKRPRRRNRMRAIKPDAYSKYVKAYRICVSGRRRRKVVDALLKMADPERKMLVVPVDDFVESIIDQNYDELSEHFILSSIKGEQGEISRLMSKSVQKKLAIEAGLPVVGSTVIKSEDGVFTIPDTVKYPCFIKPNVSENSYKTRMCRCDSEEELHQILSGYAAKQDFEMLVEDFVEIDREYSLLGLSVKEGVLCPGFFVAEVGGQKEHRGVALLGRVLPVEQQQKLIDDIAAFVGSLGFDGLFDVDLIGSTDGKMYFVELNLRYGGSGYAITQSGLNLPGMYADYKLLGKPIDFNAKVEDAGKVFVNERILLDEYVRGRLSAKEAKELISRAQIFFMKNDEDQPSTRHFKRFGPAATVTRLIRMRRERLAEAADLAAAEGLIDENEMAES